MTLRPQAIGSVPEETARVARAAFRKGNLYLRIRDELGTLYEDPSFATLFPNVGQPALAPWRLALVCLFQFIEGLSDRQAADAVRSRIDWKYILGLELGGFCIPPRNGALGFTSASPSSTLIGWGDALRLRRSLPY